MKKFLVMACIAAASMIALPAVAQTTTGSKAQTECCKKAKPIVRKSVIAPIANAKIVKRRLLVATLRQNATTRLIAANKPNAIRLRLLAAKRRM